MSFRRYQLWMRPANFAWRIIDTQADDFQSQQFAAIADGYSLWGQSDTVLDDEKFTSERKGEQ